MKHRLEDYPGAGELTLWYEKPAHTDYKGWEQQALPIGNGYMGAKVFGGIRRETNSKFNRKNGWWTRRPPGTPGYAARLRKMITARRCMNSKYARSRGK